MRFVINGWFWGQLTTGLGQYTTYLAAALAHTRQVEIIVVTPTSEQSPVTRLQSPVPTFPAPPPALPPYLARLWFEQITFPRACRQLKADVAFVPYPGLPLRPRLPTLTTVHDLIPLHYPAYRANLALQLYQHYIAAALPQAHHLFTVSHTTRHELLTQWPHLAAKTTVVYNAAAPQFRTLPTLEVIQAIRHRYHLPQQFILYLSGYAVHKNVATLLTGYAKLPARWRQNFPLVLAGAWPKRSNKLYVNPSQLIQTLALKNEVLAPGEIAEEDKPALFAAATLLAFPSAYEGFGLPVLEAMSLGTPVIASQAGSLPELTNGAALLLPLDQPSAWAEALLRLGENEAERRMWGERGRARARQFSWNAAAQQIVNIALKAAQK